MNNPPEPYDHEKHMAWLALLSPDESLIVHTPPGHLMKFIMAAVTKRALLTPNITPAWQLLLLEKMNAMTDVYFTPEMLATIQPMGDTEYEIYREARSLDAPGDKAKMTSFRILTSPRVFWLFVMANGSLLDAIKMRATAYMPPAAA